MSSSPVVSVFRMLGIRIWSRMLLGCAAILGFGASCSDLPSPVYGILMTDMGRQMPTVAVSDPVAGQMSVDVSAKQTGISKGERR